MNLRGVFNEALPVIQKFAPTIGGAIGGPFGVAAGYIIPILASAFGAHPTNLNELVHNILNDPNASTKLEGIERDHSDWICSVLQNVDRLTSAEVNIKLEWKAE